MFGKRKKEAELKAKQELEQKRIEEERLREEKLRLEMEAERKRAEEEAAKIVPYRFSVPNPKPKELIAVLTGMLKKLFPETKKAYLVLTELEDKKGYLLVVDIDAKFFKIIHMYLDGETKKVRDGLPIECILYSKSGNLTDKMEPFYQKIVPETEKKDVGSSSTSDEVKFSAMPEFGFGQISADLKKEYEQSVEESDEPVQEEAIEENVQTSEGVVAEENDELSEETVIEEVEILDEAVVEEETELSEESTVEEDGEHYEESIAEETMELPEESAVEEIVEIPEESTVEETVGIHPENEVEAAKPEETLQEPARIQPETKQQLFVMMNRVGLNPSAEDVKNASEGFGEYKFYIPYISEEKTDDISESFAPGARPVLLINRDNGIKAIVFFTDEEDAKAFSDRKECSIANIKYKDYKQALADGTLAHAAAEGIIINPDSEQILLAPDYCLL